MDKNFNNVAIFFLFKAFVFVVSGWKQATVIFFLFLLFFCFYFLMFYVSKKTRNAISCNSAAVWPRDLCSRPVSCKNCWFLKYCILFKYLFIYLNIYLFIYIILFIYYYLYLWYYLYCDIIFFIPYYTPQGKISEIRRHTFF